MTKDELVALAKSKAGEFGLEPALVCAVCEQESGWSPWAIRYEPAFFDRYVAPLENLGETEKRLRAFSFGLMQIMGQTAREKLFVQSLPQLFDPETNIDLGCKVLAAKINLAQGDVYNGLLKYNGGGNKQYPDQVLARKAKYA